MTQTSNPKAQVFNSRKLIVTTLYTAYFYAFMEWLFFVTKPSSISVLSWFEQAKVFFITGGIVALILLACLFVLALPALLINHPIWHPRLRLLGLLASAFLLTVTALLMLDNFTYTVFKFGITTTEGFWKALYAIGFILFTLWVARNIRRSLQKKRTPVSFPSLSLLIVSLIFIASAAFARNTSASGLNNDALQPSAQRPNIIILGGDGLSANYLSVYGYAHETTPFLKEMAETSLVAENAFPNASSTTASTTTMLTGREPATVKVGRQCLVRTPARHLEKPGLHHRRDRHSFLCRCSKTQPARWL
jgi:glucan phosphoethanolaminetransferase (alkaline phosphatase superfamily)